MVSAKRSSGDLCHLSTSHTRTFPPFQLQFSVAVSPQVSSSRPAFHLLDFSVDVEQHRRLLCLIQHRPGFVRSFDLAQGSADGV